MIAIALDSNILIYLAGVGHGPVDSGKIERAREIVPRLKRVAAVVAPVQALGESYVLLRRSGATADEARGVVLDMASQFAAPPSRIDTLRAAADLVVDHKLQFWDSMIPTVAAEAGCSLLLSEDMQHGFLARGMTVVNPLAELPNPRLATLLASSAA